jgi:hypothetical protein
MQVRRVSFIAGLLSLMGCTSANPVAGLPITGTETAAPPVAQRQAIESSVAMFASGRFDAGTPRWFIVPKGVPPIAIIKNVDNALGSKAKRVVETGPDQADAIMRIWSLSGSDAVVVAVLMPPRGDADGLAAYYPARIDERYTPEFVK